MAKTLHELPPHPVRSLLPALGVMEELGFDRQACLKGSGILISELESAEARMSLQQELIFYRNTLELTGDPAIGLKLGEPFIPQRYGLFGYAMLSAATFRHALTLAENFGRLTFSFYTLKFGVQGRQAWFSMAEPPPLEQELVDLYLDRDMSAARVSARSARPTWSRISIAREFSAASSEARPKNRMLAPDLACTAIATFSRTEKLGSTDVIWKVRLRPA